jgi:plastocyanin
MDRMKRMLLLPLALFAALVVAASAGADTKTVQITKNGFTPAATAVNVGDTVSWKNADTANHQVVADDGTFASPVLKSGESFSFTFQKSGKVNYRDSFATGHRGSVTVNPPAADVTLSANSNVVVYGNSTTVSGVVTNQLTNEPVTLTSQPMGKGTQSIASTTTQSNGSFSFGVSPTIQTQYQAHWRTQNSPNVTVNVAPRVGFGRSGNLFVAKATSDLSYGGRFVVVQRKGKFGGWTSVKRVTLGNNSRAVFRLRLVRGLSTLRVVLPSSQAGAGYVQGLSRQIFVRR